MTRIISLSILLSLILLLSSCHHANNQKSREFNLYYNNHISPIQFTVSEITKTLESKGYKVTHHNINHSNQQNKNSLYFITKNQLTDYFSRSINEEHLTNIENQGYLIKKLGSCGDNCYLTIGGSDIGAMYGGLAINEIIQAFGVDSIANTIQNPYIKKRGIKFNIPLDDRLPSHDDRGTAAQSNIPNMWDYSFWTEYLDCLAKQRYNVLSLWNKHPFPALIKVKDYPKVALNDVYDANGKVLNMDIDAKIELWQKVMAYAQNRGIEIYFITWNIHMNGARAKHGIRENHSSEITKDYLRKSVTELFLTYPLLAGIGVTAGENMENMKGWEKEDWLWETYGKGVMQINLLQPERKVRFIHRHWWTSYGQIAKRFGQLKDGFDMSFKYAGARVYSTPSPAFAKLKLLPHMPDSVSTWWNIRNDDIYNLRWGDPEYVRSFILNLPNGSRTAGYYLGSDRYVWARESISKNPTSPRTLENEKHWYSFLLWGRMGYDPNTSPNLLKGLIKYRFPNTEVQNLYEAWQNSSKIVPMVNKFHWFKWDYLWWVEAGISSGSGAAIAGYHNLDDFISTPVMEGSGMINISDYANIFCSGRSTNLTTPLQVADSIWLFSEQAITLTDNLKTPTHTEIWETVGDIRAMAYLGKYYASKIRGATYIKLFRSTNDIELQQKGIEHLEIAHNFWRLYYSILQKQYNQMHISHHRKFDWHKLEEDILNDIELAKSNYDIQ